MADSRWVAKANACFQAWKNVSGNAPPGRNVFIFALAQAQLETSAGDAWPLAHNWGAVNYRSCNAKELAAIEAGTLKDGNWLYPDGTTSAEHNQNAVGVLHSDSHPTPSGPSWFHVWFGAFPDDVAGAANFVRTVLRMVPKETLADPDITSSLYAQALYLKGYFEGTVAGARPLGKRSLPLTPPEQANVDSYAKVIDRISTGINSALKGWTFPEEPKPQPTPEPAPEPAPPAPEPAPEPTPEPSPEPTPPAPAPTPPAPVPHRPIVAWLAAASAAAMVFLQEHKALLIVLGIVLVAAVVLDVAIHFKKKAA